MSAEQAVDLAAGLLRDYGSHAFDIGELSANETRTLAEAWARHLLVGAEPPSLSAAAATTSEVPRRRDLAGLRSFFNRHRRDEAIAVRGGLSDLRDVVWAFITGLRLTISAEESSDRQLASGLRQLETAAKGASFEDLKQRALEMTALIAQSMAERQARQQRQVADLGKHLEKLRLELDSVREQAARDPLTGLYNRAAFDAQVKRVVDFSSLVGRTAFLLMVDLDHFKWVNDRHGHPAGDAVLRGVANSLSRSFLRKDDFVARYGGEELAIVIQEGTLASCAMLAERALQSIRDLAIEHESEQLRVTASVGVAALRAGESAEAWIERADRMLYDAKQAGRDRAKVDPDDLEAAKALAVPTGRS